MQYIYDKNGVLTKAIFSVIPGFGVQKSVNGIELDNELDNKNGYLWLYRDGQPVQVKNNRGIYYLKETGEQVEYI